MIAVQHQLAFARPLAARVRSVRRPFRPSAGEGTYRLPHEVRDRLGAALAPFRNREAAFALATFLARYHSHPARLLEGFMIDRRALADRDGLELTEARVRGAIKTLEAIGFLDRALATGSTHKATEDGLRRKPIRFVFGAEYGAAFREANKRARRAKGSDPHTRRPLAPARAPQPSAAILEVLRLSSPKDNSVAEPQVNLGELRHTSGFLPSPSASNPLEAALARLSQGVFGKPRRGSDGAK